MSGPFHPEPFSDFFVIWLIYFFYGLSLSILVFIPGCFLVALVAALRRRWASVTNYIVRLGGFLFLIVPVGGFFSALWYCTIQGNVYVTFDIDDDDFNPVLPINQMMIGQEHGRMLIGTVHQLQLIWLAFALTTWLTTFFLYLLMRHLIRTGFDSSDILRDPLLTSH
jgi:hypothetical protein